MSRPVLITLSALLLLSLAFIGWRSYSGTSSDLTYSFDYEL